MGSTEKFSLWLVPSGEVAATIQEKISELAERYDCPAFPVHLTLLPDLEISQEKMLSSARELAQQLQSFKITLGKMGSGTTYYHCVFQTVDPTPALQSAQHLAAKIFEVYSGETYSSHLSLMYGNFSMELSKQIAQSIRLQSPSFQADSLVIVPATPNPSDWLPVASIPLI